MVENGKISITYLSMLLSKPKQEFLRKPKNEGYLAWLRQLWDNYEEYAPPTFQKEIENDEGKLDSLTWEMLLANMLLDAEFELVKATSTDQPDLCVLHNETKIWIECSIPERGDSSSSNSVPETIFDGEFHEVDMDKNTLRFSSAIWEKKQQHDRWVKEGICKADEPYIVALHGKELQFQVHNSSLPDILRALYGVGDAVWAYNGDDNTLEDGGYLPKPFIEKQTGDGSTNIPTTCFLHEQFNTISGVFFSKHWYGHYSSSPQTCYVKNINTRNDTEISFADLAQEYSYTDSTISMQES